MSAEESRCYRPAVARRNPNFATPSALRDTQAFVLMAGLGRSLFDYHSAQIREHQDDWAPLLKWLKRS